MPPGCFPRAKLLNGDFMIRAEALPGKPSAVPDAEGTVLYRWALTGAERDLLEAGGWQEVARHPVHCGSALMRFAG